jgi:hypothetical protein
MVICLADSHCPYRFKIGDTGLLGRGMVVGQWRMRDISSLYLSFEALRVQFHVKGNHIRNYHFDISLTINQHFKHNGAMYLIWPRWSWKSPYAFTSHSSHTHELIKFPGRKSETVAAEEVLKNSPPEGYCAYPSSLQTLTP